MNVSKDLNTSISANLKLKSGVLAVIFGIFFILQLGIICLSDYFDLILQGFQDKRIIVVGPGILLTAAISELLSYRYISRKISRGKHISSSIIYFTVFIETSFPTAVVLFVSFITRTNPDITASQLLNSPPVAMYFIMIILSSLALDYRISLFAGIVAALEFWLLSSYLLDRQDVPVLEQLNANVRAAFIFITGLIAGLVSYKIREAVLSSLKAKDELINKLDLLVHQKTEEIRKKNEELEEKNKDITDSIHYAVRIQRSLMATEKYVQKMLSRLRAC
jgi:adenylate cyclase